MKKLPKLPADATPAQLEEALRRLAVAQAELTRLVREQGERLARLTGRMTV